MYVVGGEANRKGGLNRDGTRGEELARRAARNFADEDAIRLLDIQGVEVSTRKDVVEDGVGVFV